ncbi:MAG: hypothetical protein PHF00_02050 [Elusimicrobia bacterium]|nr:hypothetical protein [Elusimicrobiota bacterium]
MIWDIDLESGEASVTLCRGAYEREAVAMTVKLWARRARCREAGSKAGFFRIVLRPAGGPATRETLQALAGGFLCEALNQQCRLDTVKLNGNVQKLILTQALYSAQKAGERSRAAVSPARAERLAREARGMMRKSGGRANGRSA